VEIVYINGMITINETIIVILGSFLILVLILNRLMFHPLLDTIGKRKDHLATLDRDIRTAQDKATDLTARLREKEESARQEGLALKSESEAAANEQAKEIVNTARGTISSLKEETQKKVSAQVAEAKETIRQDAERLSLEIAAKILGRKLSLPKH
jgi:F-type H+-transporting ATPase subunit b